MQASLCSTLRSSPLAARQSQQKAPICTVITTHHRHFSRWYCVRERLERVCAHYRPDGVMVGSFASQTRPQAPLDERRKEQEVQLVDKAINVVDPVIK